MSLKLLIRRGRLVDPVSGIGGVMDVLLDGGTVAVIGSELSGVDAPAVDAAGLVVCAGLVDMHVHLREPGFEYKETIATGASAAARGGFTSVACMANTCPVLDTPELLEYIKRQARDAGGANVYPIAALSVGQQGKTLTDAEALRAAGAVALSDDGLPIQNSSLMRDAMIRARFNQLTILSHCEDSTLAEDRAVNEGRVSRALRLDGRPAIAEELMVMRDAMLSEETGAAVHICHISTSRAVDIVRRFKRRGVPITCETCPQYFSLTEDEVLAQGSMARVNPPLRTQPDVDAVIAGLQDGTIDAIATDHAPHSAKEKARPLTEAPSGISGLETAVGITLTELYHTGKMDLSSIIGKMTAAPARILRIPKGRLAIGTDADLVLLDPDEEWTVEPDEFVSLGRNTPFAGRRLKGRVKMTVVGGKIIYREEPIHVL